MHDIPYGDKNNWYLHKEEKKSEYPKKQYKGTEFVAAQLALAISCSAIDGVLLQ